jgi:hypothetical protein
LERSLAALEAMAATGRQGEGAARIGAIVKGLAVLERVDPLVAWAGVARLDGTVLRASDAAGGPQGALLTAWFSQGQRGR